MRISVDHTTTYSFDQPRRRVIQSHRLTPASFEGQNVISWSVEVEGGQFGATFTDGAGDRISTLSVPGPVETLVVHVSGEVETADTSGVLRGLREVAAPGIYLRKTRMTAPGVGLQALSDEVKGTPGRELDEAHALAEIVAERIEYTPGATHAEMTASGALDLGQGVCQDHAQVLIALARIRRIPARYVTGYLFADADGQMHEASHAWAELHVPDLGWVGFDPANRCCPDERYIRVGSGLDAADAAPIRGISLGAGRETMDISVTVAAQQ